MHAYRAYLEAQADRIEAVLNVNGAPVHITGGTIGPEVVRFFADPAPHIRYAAVQAQQARLSEHLGVAVTVTREPAGITFTFPTPPNPPRGAAVTRRPHRALTTAVGGRVATVAADLALYSRAAALEF